jgi:glycosyltransferase involved in cell wall biosynthesis
MNGVLRRIVGKGACGFESFIKVRGAVFKKKRLKVVVLNDSARIGGAEQSLILMGQHLDKSLFDVIVLCPTEGPLIEALTQRGVRVIPLEISHFSRKRSPLGYFASLCNVARTLRRLNVDLIHCNSSTAVHWGIPLGKLMSLRTICHIRGVRDIYPKFTSFLLRHAPQTTQFVAISNFVRAHLIGLGIPEAKITVIYNGVDIEIFHPRVRESHCGADDMEQRALRIGVIGRIDDWKRQIDVIEAAGLLSSRLSLKIFMVGEVWRANYSDQSYLQSRIIELGLKSNTVFTGFRSDIPQIMAGLDVIIVPSIDEPFGRVTIEAMALGKPVIGTFSGGTPEIIQDGTTGILVPVKNPQAIANAIETVAKNKKYAQSLGRNARRHVVEKFSVQSHVKQIQELYIRQYMPNRVG